MSEATTQPNNAGERGNGGARVLGHERAPSADAARGWPPASAFPDFGNAAEEIPPLHLPGGMPVVRDRWERLVTVIDIPAPAGEVWQALTDPDALVKWLALCHGSLEQAGRDCVLDFEDGEFFLCRVKAVEPPHLLQYHWRWLGIGQATLVTWQLEATPFGTHVTVTEEALNPPWDWQTWNGGGWPGILDQLAAYLRTGMSWRWPWRRMGPYAQVEIPLPLYQAWDQLFSRPALKYWLLASGGELEPGRSMPIFLGDASGMVEMQVREVVQPGQSPPSFLPACNFAFRRAVWETEVGGRLWLEPAGWGRSLLQVFHSNWENLPPGLQLSERRIVAGFWAGAMRRALQMCAREPALRPEATAQTSSAPHNW